MKSIRGRLQRDLTITLCALMLLCGLAVILALRIWLARQIDAELLTLARSIEAEVGIDHLSGEIVVEEDDPILARYAAGTTGHHFELWLEGGPVYRSPSLGASQLELPADLPGKRMYYDHELPDGQPGRALLIWVDPELEDHSPAGYKAPQVLIAVTRNTQDIANMYLGLLAGLMLCILLFTACIALLVPRILRSGLSPLAELAGRLERVQSGTLDTRFPLAKVPAELLPLHQQANDLLERLEQSFLREKRLAADMAHELRTPVAELRAMTDLALKWPDDVILHMRTTADANEVALQMERIVNALLTLARTEAGSQMVEKRELDLAILLQAQLAALHERVQERRLAVQLEMPESLPVNSDQGLLCSVLYNLLANAVEYCPTGGGVSVSLQMHQEQVELAIENDCSGLEQADLERMFDPFWRRKQVDDGTGRSGLGLAISLAFTKALGGSLQASLPESGRFRIVVNLPAE